MTIHEFQGLKALVVDDYVDTCNLVKFMLEMQGVATTCVHSANEALEIYQLLQPDLLIIDLNLPGEDGFSLLRKIRALSPEEGQTPAIALTGYTLEEVASEITEAGFQGLIVKPFEIDELFEVVKKILQPCVTSFHSIYRR